MIYLDNGATTYPKPPQVRKAMNDAMIQAGANPGRAGHTMAMHTAEAVFRTREAAAQLFHAEGAENVVFTLNCTQAINFVLKGLLRSGDHVVISCLEHNAVLRPLWALMKQGVAYTVARVFPGDDDRTLESFASCIKPNTRLIACTHASNVWGIRLPVERIAELAHSRGAAVLIDAAQSAGTVPIDLRSLQADYLCCAGHKGLYGPMGTGMLIFSPGAELRLNTLIEGGTGSASRSPEQPMMLPDRFESGTGNTPGVVALGAGIDFVRQKGEEKIFAHEMGLIRRLYRSLEKNPNVVLYTPQPDDNHYVPVLSFNLTDMPSEETASRLNKAGFALRAGLHCAPLAHDWAQTLQTGAVRCVPSVFTTQEHIDSLVRQITLLKNSG